jgi:hypothetical protein
MNKKCKINKTSFFSCIKKLCCSCNCIFGRKIKKKPEIEIIKLNVSTIQERKLSDYLEENYIENKKNSNDNDKNNYDKNNDNDKNVNDQVI